jgi:hypothetical protein
VTRQADPGAARARRVHQTTQGDRTVTDMATTTLRSGAGTEVPIGDAHPFVIIGERINPTGRKKLAE